MSKKEINQKEEKGPEKRAAIVPVGITSEMKDSYLDYAMSVITARALPDVRDGLKPVHRRILFSMYEMGLLAGGRFREAGGGGGGGFWENHLHGAKPVPDR